MRGARLVCVRLGIGIVLAIGCGAGGSAATVGTAFTYQGQLQRQGGPYTGSCSMQFSLWDAVSDGNQRGTTQTVPDVAVVSGLFTTAIDFGDQFSGNARWLEAAVRCTGDPGYTPLLPRQQLTATPYALSLHPGALVVGDLPNKAVLRGNNVATTAGSGVAGTSHGSGPGVSGTVLDNGTGAGVSGVSAAGTGLYGESATGFALQANGLVKLDKIDTGAGAGNEPLCRNGAFIVASCNSSSLRYKADVTSLRGGLDLVQRLRPIRFTWKADGSQDFGLGAEEVAAVEPLLVSRNERGEIEGVKYNHLSAIFIDAIKEQQVQIQAQQDLLSEQRRLMAAQRTEMTRQQASIDALRALVCLDHPTAGACAAAESAPRPLDESRRAF